MDKYGLSPEEEFDDIKTQIKYGMLEGKWDNDGYEDYFRLVWCNTDIEYKFYNKDIWDKVYNWYHYEFLNGTT